MSLVDMIGAAPRHGGGLIAIADAVLHRDRFAGAQQGHHRIEIAVQNGVHLIDLTDSPGQRCLRDGVGLGGLPGIGRYARTRRVGIGGQRPARTAE